jgi:hypothetical protein
LIGSGVGSDIGSDVGPEIGSDIGRTFAGHRKSMCVLGGKFGPNVPTNVPTNAPRLSNAPRIVENLLISDIFLNVLMGKIGEKPGAIDHHTSDNGKLGGGRCQEGSCQVR